jgi:hypothetical protein
MEAGFELGPRGLFVHLKEIQGTQGLVCVNRSRNRREDRPVGCAANRLETHEYCRVGSLNLINARRPTSHAFPDGYGGSHQRLAPPPRMWEKSGPGPLSWVEVAIETPATTNAFLDDLKASLATWRKVPLLPIVTTSERGD